MSARFPVELNIIHVGEVTDESQVHYLLRAAPTPGPAPRTGPQRIPGIEQGITMDNKEEFCKNGGVQYVSGNGSDHGRPPPEVRNNC